MAVAALRSAGYSGKSLPEKLGFKAGMNAAFIALPLEFAALADCVPFAKVVHADHWNAKLSAKTFDAIHAFTTRRIEMAANLIKLQRALKLHGMIWVSWPKKAAKVPTDVTEHIIRCEALALNLVDVKVAAIDAVWSGLKLVIRKDRR
jgi:hypothetical protein